MPDCIAQWKALLKKSNNSTYKSPMFVVVLYCANYAYHDW